MSFFSFFSEGIKSSNEILSPPSPSKNESKEISPSPKSEMSTLSVFDGESLKKASNEISPSLKEDISGISSRLNSVVASSAFSSAMVVISRSGGKSSMV